MLADVHELRRGRQHRWPVLEPDAYHGLAGRMVRAMEPHSEADPVAILAHLLSGFGNAAGRSPHVKVGPTRHHAKINAALVGETAKGRKGMSWNYAADVLGAAERYWTEERVMNGLSSGEGLIYQVRDRVMGANKEGEEYVADPGAEDKRLFVLEEEFASVLKVATREGNTLSAIIRSAWDAGRLSTLTKNTPMKASESHVSIVGHVTKTELVKLLSESDAHNGFANRFLWICVRRSKALPFGGEWHAVDAAEMVRELRSSLQFAKDMGEVRWGDTAKPIWEERYEQLSEGAPGLFGAVTSRAEAQTLRLALVYALIDSSRFIEEAHLKAALAVWRYAEASARFVFGDTTGDPVADRIEEALLETPYGLSRTEISEVLGRNQPAKRIEDALSLLYRFGRVRFEEVPARGDGKRPAQRWYVK